jgi:glycosyltransferase involved in cell wall biosynthesis
MPVRMTRIPERIGVVVPAHNEEDLLGGCLAALDQAAVRVDVPVHLVVALDACADSTAEVVRRFRPRALARLSSVALSARSVGAARAHGARFALRAGAGGVWLASTDADSVVPSHWLAAQLRHARRGAGAVVGTVRVTNWTAYPPGMRRAYERRYHSHEGHRHTHGANLGMWADGYVSVGGFRDRRSGEDVELVRRLAAAGEAVVWAADVSVVTSARRVGRAPKGFSAYLGRLADSVEVQVG